MNYTSKQLVFLARGVIVKTKKEEATQAQKEYFDFVVHTIAQHSVTRLSSRPFLLITFLVASGEINLALQLHKL